MDPHCLLQSDLKGTTYDIGTGRVEAGELTRGRDDRPGPGLGGLDSWKTWPTFYDSRMQTKTNM